MKNQYIGDIGDYGKYALLSHFARSGVSIGVNWYLTENDGSNDGKMTNYLIKEELRYLDPALFDALKKIAFLPDKSVKMIEKAGLIPGAEFYGDMLQNESEKPKAREITRRLWYNNSYLMLSNCELIFADPDNGLTTKLKASQKGTEKYVLPQEIAEYYENGKNVVYYCHKGRRDWKAWEAAKVEIKNYIRDAQIIVMTYRKGVQRSYIFVIHPDCYQKYLKILNEFERTPWYKVFWREPIGNKTPGEEKTGETFTVTLEDGSYVTLEKRVDGRINIYYSEEKGSYRIVTSEMLKDRLLR